MRQKPRGKRKVKAWAVWNSLEDYIIRGAYTSQPLIFIDKERAENALEDRGFLKVIPCTITYELKAQRKGRGKCGS